MKSATPSHNKLTETLGAARPVWDAILAALSTQYGDLTQEWKASKSEFGWMCALKQKRRTLIYLTPGADEVTVGIVLGERAATAALNSDLPDSIKILISEARNYAEGRGIRFAARNIVEATIVTKLIALKMSA